MKAKILPAIEFLRLLRLSSKQPSFKVDLVRAGLDSDVAKKIIEALKPFVKEAP